MSEDNNTNAYNSTEKSAQEKIGSSLKLCYFYKLIPLLLIISLFIFTYHVFLKNGKNMDISSEETDVYTKEYIPIGECDSELYKEVDFINDSCNKKVNKILKTVYRYPFFEIVYFVIFGVTIVVLLVIFIKDDFCIRVAKLSELSEIKNKYLTKDKNDSFPTNIVENLDIYEKNGNYEKVNKSIIQKSSIDADLLKHYMTCVTEL